MFEIKNICSGKKVKQRHTYDVEKVREILWPLNRFTIHNLDFLTSDHASHSKQNHFHSFGNKIGKS